MLQEKRDPPVFLIVAKIRQRREMMLKEILVMRHLQQGAGQRPRILVFFVILCKNIRNSSAEVLIWFEEAVLIVLRNMFGEVCFAALRYGDLEKLVFVDVLERKLVGQLESE